MDEPRCCLKRSIFDDYLESSKRAGIKRRRIETLIGKFLADCVPGLCRREKRGVGPIYEFPPLAECRAAFDRLIQQEMEWPDQEIGMTKTPTRRLYRYLRHLIARVHGKEAFAVERLLAPMIPTIPFPEVSNIKKKRPFLGPSACDTIFV
jgi:hypothetical protein